MEDELVKHDNDLAQCDKLGHLGATAKPNTTFHLNITRAWVQDRVKYKT